MAARSAFTRRLLPAAATAILLTGCAGTTEVAEQGAAVETVRSGGAPTSSPTPNTPENGKEGTTGTASGSDATGGDGGRGGNAGPDDWRLWQTRARHNPRRSPPCPKRRSRSCEAGRPDFTSR